MTDEIILSINHRLLEDSVKKLIKELSEESANSLDFSQRHNMWDLLDELHNDGYIKLKDNIDFSGFLQAISFSEPSGEGYSEPDEISSLPNNINIKFNSISEGLSAYQEKVVLPSFNTKLDDVRLPDKFLKLFKRLKNTSVNYPGFQVGETLGDVLEISTSELSNLPGIGKLYEETLKDLKDLYHKSYSLAEAAKDSYLNNVDLDNMRINYICLDKEQIKALDKLERCGLSGGISLLLDIDENQLSSLSGFGRKVINALISLQRLLQQEIREIALGNINLEAWESDILVPIKTEGLSIEKFGELLLEDIDKYFDKISDIELDVIQKRWGFVEEKKTLEEIGIEYSLTRERVRQIEKKVNGRLSRNLRFTQEFIWDMLQPMLTSNLPEKLEDLFFCFNNETDFYGVLGILSAQQNLEEYVRPLVDPCVLNNYFAENGGPAAYEDIKEYLVECEMEEVRDVDNAILYLEQQGRVLIAGEYIWPLNLKKQEAVAFVLANHPNGLPWPDIAKHVNANNFSRTPIYSDRTDHAAYGDPENIYLAGKGIYKHTRFINFSLLDMGDIFDELLIYLDKMDRDVFHLNECYRVSEVLKRQDYYVIRHIVKHYGEEYGFFFDGRSQADSVGLEKGFKYITQKDVILEAMKVNSKPLTKTQIAALLKSKSAGHASLYLDQMLESEQIVQVDRMLYTTPELAYKDIDISTYMDAIENLLIAENKPVDPSMFKEVLNSELDATYSKYFYAAIARLSANQKGWYRKHSLYSISPVPYKSLSDAVQIHCHAEQTTEHNVAILKQHVAITRETAVIAISRWQQIRRSL